MPPARVLLVLMVLAAASWVPTLAQAEPPSAAGVTLFHTIGSGHARVRVPTFAPRYSLEVMTPVQGTVGVFVSGVGQLFDVVLQTDSWKIPQRGPGQGPLGNVRAGDYDVYVLAPPGQPVTLQWSLKDLPGTLDVAMEAWSGSADTMAHLADSLPPLPTAWPVDIASSSAELAGPARVAIVFVYQTNNTVPSVGFRIAINKVQPPTGPPVAGPSLSGFAQPAGFASYGWMSMYFAEHGTYRMEHDFVAAGFHLMEYHRVGVLAFPFHAGDVRAAAADAPWSVEASPSTDVVGQGPQQAFLGPEA